MSDAAKGIEIEDVLMSIRGGDGAQEGVFAVPAASRKLVLSSEQRVEAPAPANAGAAPEPRPQEAAPPDGDNHAAPLLLLAEQRHDPADAPQEGPGEVLSLRDKIALLQREAEGDTAPHEAGDAAETASGTAFGADEAAMRALVGEMVRDELRGGFDAATEGNIRALVRDEIRRAFAAGDSD